MTVTSAFVILDGAGIGFANEVDDAPEKYMYIRSNRLNSMEHHNHLTCMWLDYCYVNSLLCYDDTCFS